jgi:hypothetical protein
VVINTFQDEFKLSNTQSSSTVVVDAVCESGLNVLDHLLADTQTVAPVLAERFISAQLLNAAPFFIAALGLRELLDDNLLVLGDGDLNLVGIAVDSGVNDAKTAEVCTTGAADLLEPFEGLLTQLVMLGCVENKEAAFEVDGHEFGGNGTAGVHKGGRRLRCFPGRAKKIKVDRPLSAAAADIEVNFVPDLTREI